MRQKLSVLRWARNSIDLTWVELLSLVAFVALVASLDRMSAPSAAVHQDPGEHVPTVVLAARR